ncbi:protein of unknown function [Candidatus Promineifilum breve]|uniref:Uncharacterized protein n=1 Tax=Candidatus Promineifilum breve TaxID=1806508 RepID=A0A160T461_9CHLR|nr:protein of unknown function [Candidatus Promineifilum breve]
MSKRLAILWMGCQPFFDQTSSRKACAQSFFAVASIDWLLLLISDTMRFIGQSAFSENMEEPSYVTRSLHFRRHPYPPRPRQSQRLAPPRPLARPAQDAVRRAARPPRPGHVAGR